MGRPAAALLALAAAAAPVAAQPWTAPACPLAGQPFGACAQPPAATDAIVSMFFQIESANGGGGFACADAAQPALVYCARNWTQPESGSVGSCYFPLPAGRGYACAAWGGAVNVIQSNTAAIAPGTLATGAPAALACPSGTLPAGGSCTLPPQPGDAWVSLAWASAGGAGFTCTAGLGGGVATTLCGYAPAATGPDNTSSCGLLLPAGAQLTCAATGPAGSAVAFTSSFATAFAAAYLQPSPRPGAACPAADPGVPNDCDCGLVNRDAAADRLVVLAAGSADANFNSFYCSVDGAAVCAWGSNSGMANASGSCTFLLPAHSAYDCTMEWGAAAFSASALLPAARSVFVIESPAAGGTSMPAHRAADARATRAERAALRARRGPGPQFVWGAGATQSEEDRGLPALWAAWRAEHARSYESPAEEAAAYGRFRQHVAAADAAAARTRGHPHLDARGRPTRFNAFADWSRAEWERAYRGKLVDPAGGAVAAAVAKANGGGGSLPPAVSAAAALGPAPPPPSPPPSLDWRTSGAVTPVKDQGQCGGCWAFSTTGALEGAGALAMHAASATPLSEQLLISCDGTNSGCGGGWPALAVDWLVANTSTRGVPVSEASYPYASAGGGAAPACVGPGGHTPVPPAATGWWAVAPTAGSGGGEGGTMEDALAAWGAAYGPVSVLVDAMTQLWWPYTGGVIADCCDDDIDHAVLLVGYNSSAPAGAEAAADAAAVSNASWWTIKNSWGPAWGEGGYVRLARGGGECGINATGNSILPSVDGGALPPWPATACPPDAAPFNVTHAATGAVTASGCVWVNGSAPAGQWAMFPSPGSYCDYMGDGYIGYTGDGRLDAADYPCPPSLYASGDGGDVLFCVLEAGQRGFHGWPPGATAYCDDLAAGRFGYTWPVGGGK